MVCLLKLKWKLLNFIECVTIQEKIISENVLFCVIQDRMVQTIYSIARKI